MSENFNYLFRYLEEEKINVSKSEFLFQIQSHPHYPNLVSVTDTLSFFNIASAVLSIEEHKMELLPNHFIALLEIENNQPQFYFVKSKNAVYFCIQDKKEIRLCKEELMLKWRKIVILAEKSENNIIKKRNIDKRIWVLYFICIIFLLLTLTQFKISILTYFFLIFPTLGTLLSIAALKDLFGIESEFLDRLCYINNSINCSTVVKSDRWKVFEILNFSDLSLIFFVTQFFCFYIFVLTGNFSTYFIIQKTLLICAFPVILISVYYQKFIAKKWCTVCLIIIALVFFESLYLTQLTKPFYNFQPKLLIQYGFIASITTLSWFLLKKTLKSQKKTEELNIIANRFARNYKVFKNNLLASTQIEKNETKIEENIVLGNTEALLKIKFITSPFCNFCSDSYAVIKDIIHKYSDKVCIDVHFNFDIKNSDEKSKRVHQELVSIYLKHGQSSFIEALNQWYKHKDESIIYKINSTKYNKTSASFKETIPKVIENVKKREENLNLILQSQFNWNRKNFINFTPAIIINGFFLPKYYDKNNLIHFINDLSEDEDFL